MNAQDAGPHAAENYPVSWRQFLERFGERRVVDTPISESAIVGAAIGASLMGLRPVAETLGRLGLERAMVVHGSDGMDEITTTGPSFVAEWQDGKLAEYEISPAQAGLPTVTTRIGALGTGASLCASSASALASISSIR